MSKLSKIVAKPMNTKPIPVKIIHEEPSKTETADSEMKYKAKYALEDIERAEGHKQDRELMKHVKGLAKKKIESLNKIK